MEATRDEIPFGLDEDESNTLAALRIAQASLEAEAVAWVWSHRKHPSEVTLVRPEDDERAEGAHWSGWSCQALYAAPPAPVSEQNSRAITQHFDTLALEAAREIMCDVNRRHEFLGGEVQLLSRIQCRIDDACRAAMLQGADGNSPVIPDGWVACSERMPKKNDKVLIFIDFNSEYVPPSIHDAEFTGSTFRRGGATVNVFPLEDGYGVTHWQPLPSHPVK
ncbi:TPA: DUF551 domain-containing protein [Enterobacter roggenkampii]|nr:DUF551 domain-containing protein [Enterobacter roggenkampii]HCK7190692.1 DUF551 domain-containing protein [Enterobacter roggenkampii]HCK7215072.1 DUF551 domain-containing protein [Enterobacter roggenkampii]HCK7220038.1 DUF551 domain-containing protein [Enterobacter roggenkampii]HCK7225380.1 DUF551 domain-containing protein [Enterobacter roggenkampii]